MWRLEKDPHLSSTFGTVMLLDHAPDFDAFRRRMERTALAIPRLRRARAAIGRVPLATDVGRRPRLRHRSARAPHRMSQTGHAAPGARSRIARRRRPVRPHPAVVAVHRRRGPARREGGPDPEDAPHDHRRRARRRAVVAVPRLRARRAGAAADRPRHRRVLRAAAADAGGHDQGSARRHDADPDRHRQAGARLARRPGRDPRRFDGGGEDDARRPQPALRHRGVAFTPVDPPFAAAPRRHARAPFRATKDAAKRLGGTLNTAFLTAAADAASAYHIEMGEPVESLRASMAISTRTDDSGGNAFTLARLLVPTGEMPIAERFLAIDEATKAARANRPRTPDSTRSPRSRRHCRPR